MEVYCENCKFAGLDHHYGKFGNYDKDAWGIYCARNRNHYNKHEFNTFTEEYIRTHKPLKRDNKGDCKHYKRKWYKFGR